MSHGKGPDHGPNQIQREEEDKKDNVLISDPDLP